MNVLKLKEFRKKLKMKQYEVAEAMNISQAYYSRLESGINLPDANQILMLSKIFDCTPNDLFGIKGAIAVSVDPLFEDYKKLVEQIKK